MRSTHLALSRYQRTVLRMPVSNVSEGPPSQIASDLRRVDRIAAIMAGTIADERDLLVIRAAVRARLLGIENIAQEAHDLDVRFFAAAADIVGFADTPALKHGADRSTVIDDIKPIAALLTVTIDRQCQPAQGMADHQGNEFFRKLIGP